MKFKTVIEVTSEAANKDEAMEIVGEYLSGNLVSGVDMKCLTRPVRPYNKIIVSVVMIILMVGVGIFSLVGIKTSQNTHVGISGLDAMQVPLKTAPVDVKGAEFKKEWQNQHIKEAIIFLKKK